LLKRFWTLVVVSAILILAVVVSAKADQRVMIGEAKIADDNTIRIPISITNEDNFIGVDMAFKYSAGVRIKAVDFENTRISYFDFKASILKETENTVVFMGLPYLTLPKKPALSAGTGKVAELVFERTDPSVTEITLEATTTSDPYHSVFFIYESNAGGQYNINKTEPVIENSSVSLSNPTNVSVPKEYGLDQNYPNPFNPDTQIKYALPANSHVELVVYNVLGQSVRILVNQDMPAGSHEANWDGKDENGNQVSSGIYFYRLSAGSYGATKKMMMLK